MPSSRIQHQAGVLAIALGVGGCTSGGGSIPSCPEDTAEGGGLCLPRCSADLDCLPEERCDALSGGVCVRKKGTPRIVKFEATPAIVDSGQVVTFQYEVENATDVEILPGVLDRTKTLSGAVNHAVQESTTFTIVAYGEGSPVRASRMVAVRGGAVGIASFNATPDMVELGNEVRLEWSVANAAPRSIRVTDPARSRIVVADAPPTGFFTEHVSDLPVEYWIEAKGFGGLVARASTRVTRTLDGRASVLHFDVLPEGSISLGDTALLEWETINASGVLLAEDGAGIFSTSDLFEVQRGFRLLAPEAGTRSYSIVAQGAFAAGGPMARSLDVRGDIAPTVLLSVSPLAREASTSQSVTVSWRVTGAEEVLLHVSDGNTSTSLPVLAQQSRTFELSPNNVRFRIVGTSKGGSVGEALESAFYIEPEQELADPTNGGLQRSLNEVVIRGRLAPAQVDEDFFAIDGLEGGTILAGLRDSDLGPCSRDHADVVLELFESDTMNVVAVSSMDSFGCPVVGLADTRAKRYFVRLSLPAGVNLQDVDYAAIGLASEPQCGDGLWFSRLEGCDDGNRVGGDGCDGTCNVEAAPSYEVSAQRDQTVEAPVDPVSPIVFRSAGGQDPLDDGTAVLRLPFPFEFYGRTYVGVVVHTNGYVSFLPEAAEGAGEGDPAMPSPERPNALIAPFWSDLRLASFPSVRGEVVHWTRLGSGSAARTFEIEFRGMTGRDHSPSSHALLNARVSLIEGINEIRIQYGDLTLVGTPSLTVVAGIEDAAGRDAVLVPQCNPTCSGANRPSGTLVVFRRKELQ